MTSKDKKHVKNIDKKYMKAALMQAGKAYQLGEVPIGCVIVYEGPSGEETSCNKKSGERLNQATLEEGNTCEISKKATVLRGSNLKKGQIIGRGYNRRTIDKSTLAHAELMAIKKACRKLGDWRLEDCVMYVTLEPCQMCAGALIQSRMKRVVIGCMNPKAGSIGSVINLLEIPGFNHQVEVKTNVLEEECSQMLKEFFKELRESKEIVLSDRS